MSGIEQARALLNIAGKDLAAPRAMCRLDAVADEIYGLHVQQVVEKALKAWLAAYTDFAARYRREVLDTSEPPLERDRLLAQVAGLFKPVSQSVADRSGHVI